MTKFDLINTIATYCITKGYAFLNGANWVQNYEASQKEFYNGQYVLGADFTQTTVTYRNGKENEISYNGVLALGIKFDDDGTDNVVDNPLTPLVDETAYFNDGTPANLDETTIQKQDRLLILKTQLNEIIKDLMCANELDVAQAIFSDELNKFDTNIDFEAAQVTFIQ